MIKAHPLYPELARLNDDVASLELQDEGSFAQNAGARITQEMQAMRRDLQTAAQRAQTALGEKQSGYLRQEDAAVAQILAQGGVSTQSASAIEERISLDSRAQVKRVDEKARRAFEAYRLGTIAQSRAALASVRQSSADRAERAYRMRADEYERQEADFALEQARGNAIERLLLRAQIMDLSLGKQAKAELQARLDVLVKKEADERAALRARDVAALALYAGTLRESIGQQEAEEAVRMQARADAEVNERGAQMRTQVLGQLGTVTPPSPASAPGAQAFSADAREKLDSLHKRYQAAYAREAAQTVEAFVQTREALSERFERLAGIDDAAQESAREEIERLRRQREDLYGRMVEQIDREAQAVAERRGVGMVTTKDTASAGGVDLTRDVVRDIESLHE